MAKRYTDYIKVEWEEHRIKLDTGINMAYCQCGPVSGPILIMVHGVTDGRVSWSQVAPIFSDRGYRCYVIEYRGNGMTDQPDQGENGYTAELITEDLISFMNKLGIESAHLIGHSYGSLICQQLLLQAPERCASCTLIDTAVDCTNNPILLRIRDGDGEAYPGLNGCLESLPETFLREWAATTNEDKSFCAATYEHVKQMSMIAWRNLFQGLTHFNNREHISEIKGNVLVLWGTEDEIFTAADQEEVKAGLKGCNLQYISVEGASHNGFWDSLAMARKYADYIDKFIKKTIA